MTNVDQFESAFRSAAKEVFRPADVQLDTVLVVTDLPPQASQGFADAVRQLLKGVGSADAIRWELLDGSQFASQGELLERTSQVAPDLVCTYRSLHSDGWRWPHSLGEYLDVLTQVHTSPVLVCPHPEEMEPEQFAGRGTDRVMAVTNHLAGDDALVNWAVKIAENDAHLLLAHVEDQAAFDRFVDVISKIPAIDTDVARRTIAEQLLKEPRDYIESCRKRLAAVGAHVKVEALVTMGHRLADYKRLVGEHEVDVLVLHTRDADQMAMNGLAYPIAVELREIPLLLL